ncbi:hypothetical protein GCM10023157_28580 [Gluconacetobacter asukensis]
MSASARAWTAGPAQTGKADRTQAATPLPTFRTPERNAPKGPPCALEPRSGTPPGHGVRKTRIGPPALRIFRQALKIQAPSILDIAVQASVS